MSSEDFIKIMDELGRRIEGPAQKVYELAIRQVYVELFVAVVLFVVFLVVALKLSKPALRKRKEWHTKYEEASKSKHVYRYDYSFFENEAPLAIAATVATFAAVFSFINLIGNLTGALNPGWKALRMILGSIT